MNTQLLAPALQRIINAVDSLPGRKGQHVPKVVLEAVENGRQELLDYQLFEKGFTFHLKNASVEALAVHVQRRIKEARSDLFPSKQRITLRGGPLDGTWHLVTTNGNAWRRELVAFEWTWPDGETVVLMYSAPNGPVDGVSYYRGQPVANYHE